VSNSKSFRLFESIVYSRILLARYIPYYLLITVLIFFGCQSKLSNDEYIQWVTAYNNGLHVRETVSGFIFDIQYQPADLLNIQQNRPLSLKTASPSNSGNSKELQHFVMTIATEDGVDIIHSNVRDVTERQERDYYFSYRFQNDITLEENGRVFPCVLYHSEGVRLGDQARTFLLAFEKSLDESSAAIIVVRSDVFGSLPIKIKVAKAGIPILRL
jgi:hypothetical protein